MGGAWPNGFPINTLLSAILRNPFYCKASQGLNEAATDHELCYYYYITMDELLNPETDERLVLYVCIIPV